MRLFLSFCVLTLSMLANSAHAAQPPCCWKGFYVGVHGEYGWLTSSTRFKPLPNTTQLNIAPLKLHPDPCGWFGGGQLGYNCQSRCLVYGIEADFAGGDISGSVTRGTTNSTGGAATPTIETKQCTDWLGTVRPRLGYTLCSRFLPYVTGGLAYGHTHYEASLNFQSAGPFVFPSSFSKVKAGWTIGGGIEYLACGNWSLKAEYLYFDLGDVSKTANPQPVFPPRQAHYTFDTEGHLFKIGLNYRFSFRC